MTPALWVAIPVGVTLGVGLWVLLSLVPRLSGPNLAARIAPYVRDISAEARAVAGRRPADPLPLFGVLAAPAVAALRSGLARLLGGDAVVLRRLRQAASPLTVEAFRSRQLLAGAAGALVGVGAAVIIWRTGTVPALLGAAAIPVAAVGGVVLPEQLLTRAAQSRLRRMGEELPTILEFLTLSLSAGEGLRDALRRVARTGTGALARELAIVVADVHAGEPLGHALTTAADALALPAFTRAVDQLVTALDRGTPLAEVLRAQAQDARDQASRELIETAGRKEVAMLVPLVFLILPVTVLFAIFPGILVLQLGF